MLSFCIFLGVLIFLREDLVLLSGRIKANQISFQGFSDSSPSTAEAELQLNCVNANDRQRKTAWASTQELCYGKTQLLLLLLDGF